MSDNVRQRYNIATGGGQVTPAAKTGSHPAYKKGGQVNGVPHTKGNPSGFKPMPKKGC